MISSEQKFILGIRVDDISLDEAVRRCLGFIKANSRQIVVTPNPEICSYGYSRKWFRRILEGAALAIPDGVGLKLGGWIIGQRIRNRTTGVDLVQTLLPIAEQEGYSIAFVGFIGGREGNGSKLLNALKNTYPRLKAVHFDGGRFSEDGLTDDSSLLTKINEASPDILCMCVGHPKQEVFLLRNRLALSAKLMLAVGGAADYIAGVRPRAPRWTRSVGAEWLFRLIIEPQRLRRIATAIFEFPYDSLRWKWGSWFVYRNNVAAVILNERDEVLVCKHSIYKYWQIPQGGVAAGESADDAVMRELREEIGTQKLTVLAKKKNAYRYAWPKHSRNFHKYKNRGQKQSVYLMRFTGRNEDIHLDSRELEEFTWIPRDAILSSSLIPDFKKTIIKIGLSLPHAAS